MKLSVPHVATYCYVPSHVMKLSVPHLATYCYVPSHVLPPANDLLIVVRPYIFVHLGCICIEYTRNTGVAMPRPIVLGPWLVTAVMHFDSSWQ